MTPTTVISQTGDIEIRDPATGTTITVPGRNSLSVTVTDDKTGKSTVAPTSVGDNGHFGGTDGLPEVNVVGHLQRNADGTFTSTLEATVTCNGASSTITLTDILNRGLVSRTVVESADPNSSNSFTEDKDGDVIQIGTVTKNPDGTKTETSTETKTGVTKTTGAYGTYTTTPNPNGSIHIEWTIPSGTGGTVDVPGGTRVTPSTPSAINPLPFNYTAPPATLDKPANSSPASSSNPAPWIAGGATALGTGLYLLTTSADRAGSVDRQTTPTGATPGQTTPCSMTPCPSASSRAHVTRRRFAFALRIPLGRY
jgi:hypothetical protein